MNLKKVCVSLCFGVYMVLIERCVVYHLNVGQEAPNIIGQKMASWDAISGRSALEFGVLDEIMTAREVPSFIGWFG